MYTRFQHKNEGKSNPRLRGRVGKGACLSETMQLGLSTLCSNQGVGLKKSLTGHYNTAACVIHENDLKWNRWQHSHCYCVLSSM